MFLRVIVVYNPKIIFCTCSELVLGPVYIQALSQLEILPRFLLDSQVASRW
jgi:hypothetical protein